MNMPQTGQNVGSDMEFRIPVGLSCQPKFSVLISVYRNDDPAYFDQALRSITVDQTRVPDEVVLVVDGPIDDSLEDVVQRWTSQPTYSFRVIRSEKNIGLSRALNLGLQHCRYPYVARMDSDDVSVPERFQTQIDYLAEHPNVDLLGAWYQQYDRDLVTCLTDRKVPRDMSKLAAYAKTRTPFNHVTGIFKRESLNGIGGYPEIDGFVEDWWVALRLIHQGRELVNLPEYLVKVRGDGDFMARRGGVQYVKHEVRNLLAMRREGLISAWDVFRNLLIRTPVRLLPLKVRTQLYKTIRQR